MDNLRNPLNWTDVDEYVAWRKTHVLPEEKTIFQGDDECATAILVMFWTCAWAHDLIAALQDLTENDPDAVIAMKVRKLLKEMRS